jgi:hypothetical protein
MVTLDGKKAILNEQALISSAKRKQTQEKLLYEQALQEVYIETAVHELTHLKQRAENRHQRGGVYSPLSPQEVEAKTAGTEAVNLWRQHQPTITIYHGSGDANLSKDKITIFNEGRKQNKDNRKFGGLYGHSESDIHLAVNYSKMQSGTPTVYAVHLKPNISILDKEGDITLLSETFINTALDAGHGVVRGKSPTGKIEYAVIDPSVISTFKPIAVDQISELKTVIKNTAPKQTSLFNTPVEPLHDIVLAIRHSIETNTELNELYTLKLRQHLERSSKLELNKQISMSLETIDNIDVKIKTSFMLDSLLGSINVKSDK